MRVDHKISTCPEKLLFLDFDGVLHRGTSGTFRKADLLLPLLNGNPELSIVLTTDWRLAESLSGLKDWLLPPLAARVVGATPQLPAGPWQRQREIERWLGGRRPVFVALDDTPSLFEPGWPPLVLTDPKEGLTNALVQVLHERLR